jgi:hypothetical protein
MALAAVGSAGLGAVQWQAAGAATAPVRVGPLSRLIEKETFETSTYHDDRLKGRMTFTVNRNGDVNWQVHLEFTGEPIRVAIWPFNAFYQREYSMACSIVDPFGLTLSRYEVSGSMRQALFGNSETKDWTDHDNPNIVRNFDAIVSGPGVVTQRQGLYDDGVNYTYDCQLDDKGRYLAG